MADISREIQAILDAVYGEEVRGSIADALTAMNAQAEDAEKWATGETPLGPVPDTDPTYNNNAKYYAEQAATVVENKVDKIAGKGLSTNDFTDEEKDALDNIKIPDNTLSVTGKAADAKATGDAITEAVDDLAESIDERKANIDGYYEDLTAGNADQLVTSVGVEDKVPYNFRRAGGGADVGTRVDETVVGGTIAWNQLAPAINSTNYDVSTAYCSGDFIDSKITATMLSVSNEARYNIKSTAPSIIAGHVYLFSEAVTTPKTSVLVYLLQGGRMYVNQRIDVAAGTKTTVSALFKSGYSTSGTFSVYFGGATLEVDDAITFENICLFDLTLMFGSEIANAVYDMETTTPGRGVAWFRNLFPKDYYAYNAGTLESVQTSAHETTGFNQFDRSVAVENKVIVWTTGTTYSSQDKALSGDYFRVVPGQVYYSNYKMALFLYDSDKAFIGLNDDNGGLILPGGQGRQRNSFTIPSGYGIAFARPVYRAAQNNDADMTKVDICINLSGSRNGEYEPYIKHAYPLDTSLKDDATDKKALHGVPKYDSSKDEMYYDGDIYAADGTVTRRYGIVNLGDLSWSYDVNNTRFLATNLNGSSQIYAGVKAPASNTIRANFINAKYPTKSFSGNDGYTDKESAFANTGNLFIKDSAYTNAATFKAAMSGVYLIYELATPTTETSDPYQSPQIVDDFGTERYVDAAYSAETPTRDFEVPVGHDSFYQANLKGKLESAPNNPASDGDYVMRRTNGQNSYVSLTQVKELPDLPTENGTYTLKCTVSGGTATLAWVAE